MPLSEGGHIKEFGRFSSEKLEKNEDNERRYGWDERLLNPWKLLFQCLSALLRQTHENFNQNSRSGTSRFP